MTGIFCALPGVVKPASSPTWANWTTANATTVIRTAADTGYTTPRGIEGINFASNDNFFVVYSDPGTPFYIDGNHKYTRSNNTVSFDSRNLSATSQALNFTNGNNISLPSFSKALLMDSANSALVCTYTSSSLTIPATGSTTTWSSIVNAGDHATMVHPTDDSIIIQYDLDGDIQLLSFNNGTDAVSVTTTTTAQSNKVTNANNGHGFWTLTGSTYKFAYVYWHTSTTSWKVRHYAADLTSYTDSNATPAFSNTTRLFANHLQPVNKCLCVVRDTANNQMPSFVISWNGTSFTQNSTATITAPDATYLDPQFIQGINYLDQDVWAVHTIWNDESADAYNRNFIGIFKADNSNNVSNLGWIQMNANSTSVGAGRSSIAISANKDYALLIGDDQTNGVCVSMIYR
jgi:hypothetical protein